MLLCFNALLVTPPPLKLSHVHVPLRGIEDPKDEGYAEVGVTETTTTPKSYPWPGNQKIIVWDLPGAGTASFKIEEYEREMEFDKFDAFIILSSERFTEIDSKIAKAVQERGKTYFFCRSKVDNDVNAERRRFKKARIRFSQDEVEAKIREDSLRNLTRVGGASGHIYLLNSLDDSEYDFNKLKMDILEALPAIKSEALGNCHAFIPSLRARTVPKFDNYPLFGLIFCMLLGLLMVVSGLLWL